MGSKTFKNTINSKQLNFNNMKNLFRKISDLKEVNEFKSFYQTPSEVDFEELTNSIKLEGQKVPIIITSDNSIIDGYRRVESLIHLGIDTVSVIVTDEPLTIKNRITYNTYRKKTLTDEVNEVKSVLLTIPKKQGSKSSDGKYSRSESIASELNHRWKSDKTIKKIETVIEKDFENNTLINGIVGAGWSVDSCFEYIDKLKELDQVNNYGLTEQLNKGEINIKEACKFIIEKDFLNKEYKDTFIIPEKSNSYKVNCVDITKYSEHLKTVDLTLTSPPFFMLRNYLNGESDQLGHEKNPHDYCKRLALIFKELIPTLKESANVIINIGDTYDKGVGLGIPDLLNFYIQQETSLIYKDRLIWSKPNPKAINETIKRPINNVEYLLWYVVNPDEAKYNLLTYTDVKKEIKITNGAKDVDETGKVWEKVKSLTKPYKKIYTHLQAQKVQGIIECATGKNTEVYDIISQGHPAIMAELLPVVPILMTTDEGDVVYDPFAGSNVVGRMTCLLNRVALSTELSTQYHKIGCKMLENAVRDFRPDDLNVINSEIIDESNLKAA